MARGCGVRGRSWGAFCGDGEVDAHVLSWGAASFGVSGLPAACHADAASVPTPRVAPYGGAGSDGPKAGAGLVGHLKWGGGDQAGVEEGQGVQRG